MPVNRAESPPSAARLVGRFELRNTHYRTVHLKLSKLTVPNTLEQLRIVFHQSIGIYRYHGGEPAVQTFKFILAANVVRF